MTIVIVVLFGACSDINQDELLLPRDTADTAAATGYAEFKKQWMNAKSAL